MTFLVIIMKSSQVGSIQSVIVNKLKQRFGIQAGRSCKVIIDCGQNKMGDRRPWTEEEDILLKNVYERGGLTKWSHIARKLQEEHGLRGRNGKQCKERYITFINPSHPKEEWSFADEQKMFDLHNDLGNKWAVIGAKLAGRSDNCVKNHFYSKLRKALKKVNKAIALAARKDLRDIKPNVLYRIVEVVEEKFKELPKFDRQFSSFSNKLKNQLLDFSYSDDVQQGPQDLNIDQAKELIDRINEFSANYKQKSKKDRGGTKDLLTPNRYQRIRKCHSQNEQSEGSSSNMPSSDTSNCQDLSDDVVRSTNSRKRKNSQDQSSLQAPRIRTRAYSQGNARQSPVSIKVSQPQPQQEDDKLQKQFQDLNILQQQILPPLPGMMKKQTSKYSRYSAENIIDHQQYHFFEDSEIEMRILPEMLQCAHKESHCQENFFG